MIRKARIRLAIGAVVTPSARRIRRQPPGRSQAHRDERTTGRLRPGGALLITIMVIVPTGSAFVGTRAMVGDSVVAAMLTMLIMLSILPIASALRRSPISSRRQS
jgi:hypothetical protein